MEPLVSIASTKPLSTSLNFHHLRTHHLAHSPQTPLTNTFASSSLSHRRTMPVTIWDGAAHLCLLQAVFDSLTFTSDEWEKILKFTRDRGYEYTSGAAVYIFPSLPFSSSQSCLPPKQPRLTFVQLSFPFPLTSHQSQPSQLRVASFDLPLYNLSSLLSPRSDDIPPWPTSG